MSQAARTRTLDQETAMLRMASTAADSAAGTAVAAISLLRLISTSDAEIIESATRAAEELEETISRLHRFNLHFVQLIEALHTPKR